MYAQIPFLLNNLGDTETMVDTISQIRDICEKFANNGLPNFPYGIPFTFWVQYLSLRLHLLVAIGSCLGAVFITICFLMMSPWTAAVVIIIIGSILAQLLGVQGLLGIKLSAVPAVILILDKLEDTFKTIKNDSFGKQAELCLRQTSGRHLRFKI